MGYTLLEYIRYIYRNVQRVGVRVSIRGQTRGVRGRRSTAVIWVLRNCRIHWLLRLRILEVTEQEGPGMQLQSRIEGLASPWRARLSASRGPFPLPRSCKCSSEPSYVILPLAAAGWRQLPLEFVLKHTFSVGIKLHWRKRTYFACGAGCFYRGAELHTLHLSKCSPYRWEIQTS